MNGYIDFFYQKVAQLKWLFTFVLGFFLVIFITIGFVLTPFGLNRQTLIYQKNWTQALEKYLPKTTYLLNQNFTNYGEITLTELTKVFNKNAENILTGLIANKLQTSLDKALEIKDDELVGLDRQLLLIYQNQNDLWEIITSYNNLLLTIVKKYTDFSLNNNGWKTALNESSIKNFISPNYKNNYLYKVELNYLTNGDETYHWIDNQNNLVYFQGMQTYEYYSYQNYLTVLDAFMSGSIATNNPILLGEWKIDDLAYLQFLKGRMLEENFYYPTYYQAFIMQRIADITLFIILPTQVILTIFLLIFIWQNQLLWNWYKKHHIKVLYKKRIFTMMG